MKIATQKRTEVDIIILDKTFKSRTVTSNKYIYMYLKVNASRRYKEDITTIDITAPKSPKTYKQLQNWMSKQ